MPEVTFNQPRIGFLTGQESQWHKLQLAAKYFAMRAQGQIYPDVYALPYFITSRFDFLRSGEKIHVGSYDLLLAEMPGSETQLAYLKRLVCRKDPPIAVIPGPPEILFRDMTDRKLALVKQILHEARYVWAYSHSIRTFYDEMIGEKKGILIPWPFDLKKTLKAAGSSTSEKRDVLKVLVQVPLRFSGVTQNNPMEIKAILKSIWQGLPCNLQKRVSFHTFVYTKADEVKYSSLRYAEGLPLKLERKMGYVSFVRFVQGCDVVINLTTGSILGRITFLSAALGKPGVFSDNAEINRALYPNSCIAMSDKANLRTQLWRLLLSGLERQVDDSFHPLASAVEDIGDYSANTARMRALITG